MNACSAFVFAAIAAIMIVGSDADRKHCFCDLRWSTTRLSVGDSISGLTLLTDLNNPSYHHWLSVGCRRVLRGCPHDCLNTAHSWMGGSAFSVTSGREACEIIRRNAPPSSPIYVYATYDPSVCGDRTWQYVGQLCCWRFSVPGYHDLFLHNHQCANRCPPNNPQC